MANKKRKEIPKKIRFEVFKRDSFTCQYCGRSAPDVILEVDHIQPVSAGGDNSIMNLVTSCRDCNRGKGGNTLSDDAVVRKQKAQMDELQAKKNELDEKIEQMKMMAEWRNSLIEVQEQQVSAIEQILISYCGMGFSDYGRATCKRDIRRFGFALLFESTQIAFETYYNGDYESAQVALQKSGGIAYNKKHGITRRGDIYGD